MVQPLWKMIRFLLDEHSELTLMITRLLTIYLEQGNASTPKQPLVQEVLSINKFIITAQKGETTQWPSTDE